MVLAGLTAEGSTEVSDINHIRRGYEDFEEKLRSIGADIRKIS
jgi:UDP-N-acetylglucosamine 1-carboxyvinyltransferase